MFFTSLPLGIVDNGPAVFAQYLWQHFSEDRDLNFHIVAPASDIVHPRIHLTKESFSSRQLYFNIQKRSLEVANELGDSVILHSNISHACWALGRHSGPLLAQVNDYDAANCFERPIETIREYGIARFASLAWRHTMERRAAENATYLVCNSSYTRQQAIKQYGSLSKNDPIVIHKGVDTSAFGSEVRACQLVDSNRLLFVGSNWYRKGLDVLLNALPLVCEEFPDVRLKVAGEQSQKRDAKIRLLVQQLQMCEKVDFLGRIDRKLLPELMARSRLLVLPSRQEALGVVVLEALASGLPVIASRVGGIPEILEGCTYSSLVSADDPHELAQSIKLMLRCKHPIEKVQAEGMSIATKFSVDVMIKRLKQLYLSL